MTDLSISPAGIELIKKFEQFVPHTYTDAVGVLTIGYGSTMYRDGTKPKHGETISEPEAADLLAWGVNIRARAIQHEILSLLNQNQQDAVLSLVYNIGVGGFVKSTVLKLINQDPNDAAIRRAFLMWNKGHVNGKLVELPGLTSRRNKEADLYFKRVE
jgi:lysozyme